MIPNCLLTLGVVGAIGKYTKRVNAHSNLCDITLVVTKVHVVLRSSVVLKWLCDKCSACHYENNIKCNIAMLKLMNSYMGHE